MKNLTKYLLLLLATSISFGLVAQESEVAEADTDTDYIEEIVTATSRETTILEVPYNISTLSGDVITGRTILDEGELLRNFAGLGGSASKTNSFAGAMATNQSNSLSGTLSATVVRVFPNGNLEIKGQKKLRITEGTEYIRLSGIIRPQDISTTNSVSSSKIAEAQIEYVGAGILDSASKPGWGSAIFRAISPF